LAGLAVAALAEVGLVLAELVAVKWVEVEVEVEAELRVLAQRQRACWPERPSLPQYKVGYSYQRLEQPLGVAPGGLLVDYSCISLLTWLLFTITIIPE
jgi:hypothetical protein